MAKRILGLGLPLGGLVAGVVALALWVAVLSARWIDPLVCMQLMLGMGLSTAAYLACSEAAPRRLGVVGIACNGVGLIAWATSYALG